MDLITTANIQLFFEIYKLFCKICCKISPIRRIGQIGLIGLIGRREDAEIQDGRGRKVRSPVSGVWSPYGRKTEEAEDMDAEVQDGQGRKDKEKVIKEKEPKRKL